MGSIIEIKVPDIGDFENVEVIEVLVVAGDHVEQNASLITLESDKSAMEIPSPRSGVIREVCIAVGDRVSEGTLMIRIETDEVAEAAPTESVEAQATEAESEHQPVPEPTPIPTPTPTLEQASASPAPVKPRTPSDAHSDVVVLGGGPGGYTAAFRAADLGLQVTIIERYERLGGVCLNVGCIPSKALLHIAEVVNEARELRAHGVDFGEPRFDLEKLRGFKNKVVGDLTQGLKGLAKRRNVTVLQGTGRFNGPDQISVETADGSSTISFNDCIIATGSRSIELPGIPHDDPRVMDSTDALELDEVPARLLVIGGGIIGLEMAGVYDALGSSVTVVELTNELIPGCDRDLVKPLQRLISKRYENIYLGTEVVQVQVQPDGLEVLFDGPDAPETERFDRVLVAVGRRPNSAAIEADKAGVSVDERGFIPVDSQMRTSVPHIYAIGDIVGQPMLAHKATHEGKTAAEVIAGLPASFDAKTIPSVAYTDPEVAWMGLSETAAKAQGIEYEKASFPWAASGRAQGIGRAEGVTKLIFDAKTRRILGAGITGRNAGELIGETVLALEMGADAQDLALTIHAHPTLSETINFASEMVEGTITDLYLPKRK